MAHEHWDAEEFVERMIDGDRSLMDSFAELSAEQLAEVELVLTRRVLHA